MLEQHLLDVGEVLEIFCRRKLFAISCKCEFWRLSKEGVSVDPPKVRTIVEWAMPTSCSKMLCFTGLANFYHCFVEGHS